MPKSDRLQKVLARAGVASRRHAEELITAGRVRVNGRIVSELGAKVDPRRDKVEVDGRRVIAEPIVYYMFHKPRGTVTTLEDPEGRATIKDYLKDIPARVYPVGRLDFHTSGALILTNDGDLAQALLHPRRSVAKTYVAKVRGVPTDAQIHPMRTGMELPPFGDEPAVKTRPADVEVLRHAPSGLGAQTEDGTTWLKITLREGRNRQIHRMAEAVGLFVMRLARIAFAGLTTESLRPGELRQLTDKELTMLRATYLRPIEEAAERSGSKRPTAAREEPGEVESWGDEDAGGEESAEEEAPRPSYTKRKVPYSEAGGARRESVGERAARVWGEREQNERAGVGREEAAPARGGSRGRDEQWVSDQGARGGRGERGSGTGRGTGTFTGGTRGGAPAKREGGFAKRDDRDGPRGARGTGGREERVGARRDAPGGSGFAKRDDRGGARGGFGARDERGPAKREGGFAKRDDRGGPRGAGGTAAREERVGARRDAPGGTGFAKREDRGGARGGFGARDERGPAKRAKIAFGERDDRAGGARSARGFGARDERGPSKRDDRGGARGGFGAREERGGPGRGPAKRDDRGGARGPAKTASPRPTRGKDAGRESTREPRRDERKTRR